MRFIRRDLGNAADASSGGGTRGLIIETVWLAAPGLVLFVAVYLVIALITEAAVSRLPIERERALFSSLSYPEYTTEPPPRYAETWARAEAVLAQLAVVPGVTALEYRLFFADAPAVNALALPGGSIVLTRGLLEALPEGEVALSFVIGHELGHFAHRDHLRSFGRAAGLRFALFVFFGGDLEAITSNAARLMLLHESREAETAADFFAMHCFRAVDGNDAGGVQTFFESLRNQPRMPEWAYMFSAHPEFEERVNAITGPMHSGAASHAP